MLPSFVVEEELADAKLSSGVVPWLDDLTHGQFQGSLGAHTEWKHSLRIAETFASPTGLTSRRNKVQSKNGRHDIARSQKEA